jgi:hypothetical protein
MTAAFQTNAFQPNAFQVLVVTGVLNATDQNDTGSFAGTVGGVVPVIEIDMHDGDKKRKKYLKEEAAKAKKRRNEVVALFEHLVEGNPLIAEEIAAPFIKQATISELNPVEFVKTVDFDALMADLAKVQQIYDAYIEMDDEEVLALL